MDVGPISQDVGKVLNVFKSQFPQLLTGVLKMAICMVKD